MLIAVVLFHLQGWFSDECIHTRWLGHISSVRDTAIPVCDDFFVCERAAAAGAERSGNPSDADFQVEPPAKQRSKGAGALQRLLIGSGANGSSISEALGSDLDKDNVNN